MVYLITYELINMLFNRSTHVYQRFKKNNPNRNRARVFQERGQKSCDAQTWSPAKELREGPANRTEVPTSFHRARLVSSQI